MGMPPDAAGGPGRSEIFPSGPGPGSRRGRAPKRPGELVRRALAGKVVFIGVWGMNSEQEKKQVSPSRKISEIGVALPSVLGTPVVLTTPSNGDR